MWVDKLSILTAGAIGEAMTIRRNWPAIAGLLIVLALLAQEVFIVEGWRYLFSRYREFTWSPWIAMANVYYFLGIALAVSAAIVCIARARVLAIWLVSLALFVFVTTNVWLILVDWHTSGDTLANTIVFDVKLYILGIAPNQVGVMQFYPHEVLGGVVAWILLLLALAVLVAGRRPPRHPAEPDSPAPTVADVHAVDTTNDWLVVEPLPQSYAQAPLPPAGWYAHPTRPGEQAYWDGSTWVEIEGSRLSQ